jgi:ABC-type branched-subunit amino acid transport system substrate-binding protein
VDSFVSNAENHPLQPEAAEMKALFNKLSIIEPNKIGVLLPLSGNFSKYGQLSLNSIMMALSALEDMPVNADAKKNKVTLVLRDSGESVESALKGFDQLVADDHVVGVIGPLLSRQAVAVAQKAQEYGVPIFSISQKQGLEQVGNYVFPIALTPSQQIQAMINFTMKERGFKRFAILAPESPAGEEYVRLFWDLVEQNGGDITGIERYTPGSTDFRDEIKRLVGLEYLDSRKLELEDLKRREDNYASKLKVRGVLRKRLLAAFRPKPIIDFDAIFVPDGPQAIGQIAPSFAVQDVKNIPFLGINTWNTPEIIRRAGQYLQNSYFVDIFYPNSRGKLAAEFIADYSRFFGSTPGTLEVQAYDASRILMSAIESGSVGSRADLVNYILTKKNYSGISGKFNFTSGGLERSAYLLGVKGTEILEIMPPILVR